MGGFTSSKAILDIIKAQAAGKRAEIDLQQALQLQSAEGQLAAEEAKQKQAEEQQKARQQQQKGQGKQQATPPDFVQLDAASAGRSTAPQSNLDNATQAVGGGGAQQFLQQLQGARGGGGTQAPGAGIPSQAQALGQPQQQGNVPSRLNSVGFQSSTGGGSLAEALGQPRNTINFQSDPNALSPFQQGSLGIAQQRNDIAAAGERAQLFQKIFSTIPDISAAQAQAGARAIFDDDTIGVINAFRGSEEKLRQVYELGIDRSLLENEKLFQEGRLLRAKTLSETGALGALDASGMMTVPQILGMPGQGDTPMTDEQLFNNTTKLFQKDRLGIRTDNLQGDGEALAPTLQTAALARSQVLLLKERGSTIGAFLALGGSDEEQFGLLKMQAFLDAFNVMKDTNATRAQKDKAKALLFNLYLNENNSFLREDGRAITRDGINKVSGDAVLAMASMIEQAEIALGRKEGTMTLLEFRQLITAARMESLLGGQGGGQLGTTP